MPDAPAKSIVQARGQSPLPIDQLRALVNELAAPRGSQDGVRGRFAALHELLERQEQHFYTQKGADPKLPPPDEKVEGYQTDILRRTFVELKARLVENPFAIVVTSPDDTKGVLKKEATQREAIMTRGLDLIQERAGVGLLEGLADGQIKDCYGVLHWTKDVHVWPSFPTPQTVDELPDDKDERARFRDEPRDDGKFEETDTSRQKRDQVAKAKSGYPWHAEVIRPANFAFVQDRSVRNGMREALVLRTVPFIELAEKLRDQGIKATYRRINQYAERLHFSPEGDAPSFTDPSKEQSTAWRGVVLVATYWTRTHFFELAATTDQSGASRGDWELVQWGTHPYRMPPFALARATHTNHPDPALAYAPALRGLYRMKPFVDHDVTLGRAIARKIALPFFWIKTAAGEYVMDDDGTTRVILTHETAAAYAFPAGATLEKVDFEMNAAFLGFLEIAREELNDSAPQIGNIEIGASTQPWTLRQAIEFANVLVKQLKLEAAKAINTMVDNMAMVNGLTAEEGGFGQPIALFIRGKSRLELQEAFGVDEPDQAPFEYKVTIDPNSSAQVIANIEHMRTLLEAGHMTQREFVEDGLRKPDPDAYIAELQSESFYRQHVWPGLQRQEAAKRYGVQFVLSADGTAVNGAGDAVAPEQVLATRGFQPAPPNPEGQPLPDLPMLNVPGTLPESGLPG